MLSRYFGEDQYECKINGCVGNGYMTGVLTTQSIDK